jgi:phosphoribosylglycinamide formyltransferase-1
MKKIAVFASGSGSNFQAIVNDIKQNELPIEVSLLVCDQAKAHVIKRAELEGIPTLVLSPKAFLSKRDYEEKILSALKEREVEYLALAGYLRIVGKTILDAYEGNIVNIHPSLLPDFPGLHAIEQAWKAGVTETGVTVHYVDAGLDTGEIIEQRKVQVTSTDTLETLTEKIHSLEHEMYPRILNQLLEVANTLK